MKFLSNRTKQTSFTLKTRNCPKTDYFLVYLFEIVANF